MTAKRPLRASKAPIKPKSSSGIGRSRISPSEASILVERPLTVVVPLIEGSHA